MLEHYDTLDISILQKILYTYTINIHNIKNNYYNQSTIIFFL